MTPKSEDGMSSSTRNALHHKTVLAGLTRDLRQVDEELDFWQSIIHRDQLAGALPSLPSGVASPRSSAVSEVQDHKQQFERSEDHFRTTLESIQDAVIATDLLGRIIRMNPVAQRLTGWSARQAMGQPFGRVFRTQPVEPGQYESSSPSEFADAGLGAQEDATELLLTCRSGGLRRVSCSATSVRDGGKVSTGLVVVFRDITQQHAMQQEIRRTEDRFRTLVETAPEGIFLFDVSRGVFSDANQAGLKLLGMQQAQVFASHVVDISPEFQPDGTPSAAAAEEKLARALAGEALVFDWEHINRKTGKTFPCEVRLVRWPSPGKILRCTLVNISERKQAEQQLRRSEEFLRTTLNSIGDAVIATDLEGRVTSMNLVAEQLTGWTAAEALERPLSELAPIVDSTTEAAPDLVKLALSGGGGRCVSRGMKLVSRSGKSHAISNSVAPIQSETGECFGVVLVFRDITAEQLLQEKLRQSEKLQAIGQLAGGIAHDFNNMLAAIKSSAELLRIHVPEASCSNVASECVDMILQASTRATELTSKMLTFARQNQISTAHTNLHTLIQDTVDILSRTIDRRIRIQLDLQAARACAQADWTALESAVLNIGINASHAMLHGGQIAIQTRNVVLDADQAAASVFEMSAGEYCEITIADNGHGIAPENLAKIFDPFFTTKEPGRGTGLGLSAAYGTIQDHHGSIEVASQVGKGTEFRLLLPVSEAGATLPNAPAGPPNGSGCILLADDEHLVRTSARMLLISLGYHVLEATNGLEATQLYKQHQHEIDAVLLGLNMPVMGGREAFERIRILDPNARVVVVSGFLGSEHLLGLDRLKPSAVLSKPYSATDLCDALLSAIAAG